MSDNTSTTPQDNLVTLEIDGQSVSVLKGTMVIRAAEKLGIRIPRFCDHPLLDPVAACRQCMVEVPDAGNGRGFPKPQASCSLAVAEGMVVKTQASSMLAKEAQRGIMELLLINHPLDCPICDKGGECPLQNQAMSDGQGETRFDCEKRHFPTPLPLVSNVLLDRERCVLCTRCTRFSEQVSGDRCIALAERGARQQISSVPESDAGSYFSGNTVQICPVGALTSADYRFQARPFDLVSTETTCEHCASGCALRVDHRHSKITRRLAGEDADVNLEWNCDKGRYGFRYGTLPDRITTPLVRRDGKLMEASWPEAISLAAKELTAAGSSVGVLTGASHTVENAYAYAGFARNVVGTNNIDFRSDKETAEEAAFLTQYVAHTAAGDTITYQDLDEAKKVVLVCLDPEDEAANLFLRLRRAVRKKGLQVVSIASHRTIGTDKLNAEVVTCKPGTEAEALTQLDGLDSDTIILVGARAAASTGTFKAVVAAADKTGARFAWVPLHAGDRGALEAGCLPTADGIPTKAMLEAAAAAGELQALVLGALDERDFADIQLLRKAADTAFTIQLAQRHTELSDCADVVFPVSLISEVTGHFLNWEARWRNVQPLHGVPVTTMSDRRVLGTIAQAMGTSLKIPASTKIADLLRTAATGTAGGAMPPVADSASHGLVLDSWRELMGDSAALDGTIFKGSDHRRGRLRVSPATAAAYGLTAGGAATVATSQGSITLPVSVIPEMADDVVWVPSNVPGNPLAVTGAEPGDQVTLVPSDDAHTVRMEVPSRV